MDAEALLCDYAEALNGKLYISGGGWSVVGLARPLRCSLAIRLATGWSEANVRQQLRVTLVTQDGQPALGPDGKPVLFEGDIEVGRPPGMAQGEDIVNCLVLSYEGLDLAAGSYEFKVEIDAKVIKTVQFRVIRPEVPQQ
ncbi:MAG: hypothetical protein WA938_02565 [Candidatus Dormiibacterota bacterium]